tara:strand:- start:76 stop:435 length:360 start_codon:yes stop_codon:yes gene_type:complete
MSEKDKPKYKTKVTKLEVDSKEAIDLLVKQVNELKTKLKLISSLQQAIVEYLGNKSADFRATAVASVMQHQMFRDDFTKFLNESDDVPDEVKLTNMEINEKIDEYIKEVEKNLKGDKNA